MTAFVRVAGLFLFMVGTMAASLDEAERLYKEGSYQLAREAYQKIDASDLSPEERRWVQFRLAETRARSQAASRQPDDSALRQAESELREYVQENAVRDRVWAETHEALADVTRSAAGRGLHGAWSHYSEALEYWAGSTNLTLAAEKYWGLLRKAAEPPEIQPMWYYGSFGTYIPLPVLENALKIARNDEERARAHFMIAMTLRSQGGDWEHRFRVPDEFEAALQLKKETGWYDDALYFYGEWMSRNGRAVQDENGSWRTEPDFVKALEVFRRLTSEFRKGETPWFDDAQNRIRDITRETVDVNVSNTFLPGSEIAFHLRARNVDSVAFTLYRVDLTEDFSFQSDNTEWQSGFSPNRARQVKSWTKVLDKRKPYTQTSETIQLEETLAPGAYVLEGRAGNTFDREMLLVTDAALVIESAGRQALIYACDSANGAPLAKSKVTLWERYYENSRWRWRKQSREADLQGLALFELNSPEGNPTLLASIKSGERQAFSYGASNFYPREDDQWKIFAFPDKPAYRPGEKVQWKVIARRHRGESYSTPAGQKLVLRLLDPRGAEVNKETLSLNDFGSAWGDFELKSELPLGEYQAIFELSNREIGRAPLFRLEEYKLPEFKVTVQTPEENGRKKTYLLGESVEVEIAAEYYFGGPVANATAELVISQAPYYHIWTERREFPWLHQKSEPFRAPRDPGQIVRRETLKTDSNGKARLTFSTPIGAGNELEYRIEARVTDASRREISGSDRVRVGRQRFYVHPNPARKIYKPQDKVEVEFRVLDANDQPVSAEGTVQVTRDFWFEIWLAPDGREVKGTELKQLQSAAIFPPVPPPGQRPWRLKFRGYEQDQILTRTLKSGTNGLAQLTFTPEREGYYRVTWRTDEAVKPGSIPSRPIRAETTVWVATTQSAEIGYRSGRFEILADKDTFRAGQKAVVMLSAPTNDRYILLTTTGGALLDYRLVHLDGSVKLLEFDIDERHVPNFFLHGTMVADQEVSSDQKEIVVPPVKNFLTVEVEPERSEYRPGEPGKLRVRTLNSEGEPVPAEIALTLYDESVSYIQEDYAGDPREFFFGDKRPNLLSSLSSFNYRPYRKVVERDEGEIELRRQTLGRGRADFRGGLQGGSPPVAADALAARSLSLYDSEDKGRFAELPMIKMKSESLLEMSVSSAAAAPESAVEVRSDFRSAVLWEPALRTDSDGRAETSFVYPGTLTSWKAVARATTKQSQFGVDDALTRTKQPLSIRLQAPRFFLVGDTVTLSALINNNTSESLVVSPEIVAEGLPLETPKRDSLKVAPGAEARVDWTARPAKPGDTRVKVIVRGGSYSDAMEKAFPVYEHGIEKFLATSGKSKDDRVLASLELPAARKPGSTEFTVQVTPSLAVTMLDALPYLINYPYGCTEQTMSRFLPAAITSKTLKDLGLSTEDVLRRVFGGIEANAPKGEKRLDQLTGITRQGLERLYNFQHEDGGWGWWKEGESDPFMTAYVVWGLSLARAGGVEVDAQVLEKGAAFLNTHLVEAERNYDMQAFMLHAIAGLGNRPSPEQLTAFQNLWEHRDQLNAYSRALVALAADALEKRDEARTLVRNLANGVKRGDATAHWGEDGLHWRWSEGGVEATAFALRALLAIDPRNELVEPVANWLIRNRRGAQWSNTRDTAIVLLALNDYLRATGELKGNLEYEVFVNDRSVGTNKIAGADVFSAPKKFRIAENLIKDGKNEVRIQRKSGDAPIYYAVECSFFSLEEPIVPAGNEIFVQRRYYRISPVPTLLKGYTYRKQELQPGESIRSGDRIETVLTIEAKNNYEYLVFEDLKASGVEAVEIRSGEALYAHRLRESSLTPKPGPAPNEPTIQNDRTEAQTGESRWVYQELRDRKVALFIDKLPQGFWEIRYETRAETPGEFHALPVLGHAMYVPEIRANSAESKIRIYDTEKGQL